MVYMDNYEDLDPNEGYKDPDSGVIHGTINAYVNHQCRCGACRSVYRDYQMDKTKARKALGLGFPDYRHGSYNGYTNYGCRCDWCKEANTLHAREYRHRNGL
jgi:hypothetical protein